MDFNLTEDQRAIEDAARAFAQAELAPNSARWDEDKHFPVDVVRKAAEKPPLFIVCHRLSSRGAKLSGDLVDADTGAVVAEAGAKMTPRLIKKLIEAGLKAQRVTTPATVDRIAPTIAKAIRIRAPNACSSAPLQ